MPYTPEEQHAIAADLAREWSQAPGHIAQLTALLGTRSVGEVVFYAVQRGIELGLAAHDEEEW
jgi:hypothetical protein